MIRQLGMAAAMFLALGAMQADAGVQDSVFEGTVFRIPTFGGMFEFVSEGLTADFGDDFNAFREDFGDDTRLGSYDEDDNGFFSSWTVNYALENDYEASGFCLFNFITTYEINEIEGDDDYIGILFRTGDSELIDVRPPQE